MSLTRCNICGNLYDGEQWEICPFCHNRADWIVYPVPDGKQEGDPEVFRAYHMFSERSFLGIYLDTGIGEFWLPVKGNGYRYVSHDKEVSRSHPLFNARNALRRAKMEKSFIIDERLL